MNRLFLTSVILVMVGCSSRSVYTPLSLEATSLYQQQNSKNHSASAVRLYRLLKESKTKDEANHYAYLLKRELEIEREKEEIEKLSSRLKKPTKIRVSTKPSRVVIDNLDNNETANIDENQTEAPTIAELDIKKSLNGYSLAVKESYFMPDTLKLRDEYSKSFEKFTTMLKEDENSSIFLKADSFGESIDSMDNAIKRVKKVKELLIKSGINSSRIKIKRYKLDDLI